MKRLTCLWVVMFMTTFIATQQASAQQTEIATFAGGCFWCMKHPFDELDGVISTTSDYTGGHKEHPSYEEVSSGSIDHAEAIQIRFNPIRYKFYRYNCGRDQRL